MLAVLKSFGDDIEQLNGTNVHSLPDIITMQSDVHEWLTRLEIRFEKTVRNHAHTTLSHPNPPPSETTTQSDPSLPTLTNNIRHPRQREPPRSIIALQRSPSFLGQSSTLISKTVSLKTWVLPGYPSRRWKFGGGVERRPIEEHEPTYTTSPKPLCSSPSPISVTSLPVLPQGS